MNSQDTATQSTRKPLAWRQGAIAVGLLTGGFALGAVSFASADGMGGWHGGHHHHGPRVGMIQHVVHRALDSVGATTAQEDKVHDIIAATYTGLDQDKGEHEAMRKQAIALLSAPTIDRAAAEKLRADAVARFDAKSKTIVSAMLDAAGQLTPDQRTKLAAEVQDRMDHHGWRHHDGMDDHGGQDENHGPDRGDH